MQDTFAARPWSTILVNALQAEAPLSIGHACRWKTDAEAAFHRPNGPQATAAALPWDLHMSLSAAGRRLVTTHSRHNQLFTQPATAHANTENADVNATAYS